MSHEVETMMYVGATPWHKLGAKLDNPPTTAEAIKAAGLDWSVSARQLFMADGQAVNARAIVRDSDGKVLAHHVGPDFTPLQNSAAFRWFDPFLQSGEATIETAASLRGGARIFILARIARTAGVIVPQADDTVEKYVLLANSHDGSLACRAGFTPIRTVCANTLAAAFSHEATKLLSIRHTKSIVDSLDGVRDLMNLADQRFEATFQQYRFLASKDISTAQLERFVTLVLKPRPSRKETLAKVQAEAKARAAMAEAPIVGEGSAVDSILAAGGVETNGSALVHELLMETEKDRASRSYEAVMGNFENGRGNDLPGVKGTWWAAYNAVTEYLTHDRRGSAESRLDSLGFGNSAKLSQVALQQAVKLAS